MDRFDEYELDDPNRSGAEDEWGGGFEGDDDFDNGPRMEATFDQLQHSSRADDCGGLPVAVPGGKLIDLSRTINQLTTDPEERFKRHVGAIAHILTEDDIFDISIDDRNAMCRRAGRLDKVKYLNATAYILGYVITRGGKKIDNKLMQKAFANLRYMNDDSVKPSDVVRYARYWEKIGPSV